MKIFNIVTRKFYYPILLTFLAACANDPGKLVINEQEYFEMPGINVMVYHDYYPSGHQSGVTLIQNGIRVAANGDIRVINADRPAPVYGERKIDLTNNEISIDVGYPDSMRNEVQDPRFRLPELQFISTVRVKGEGKSIRIIIDLDKPLPSEWADKIVFRMELFPATYFHKTYYMDNIPGLFPRQANGPVTRKENGYPEIAPLAKGKKLVVLPEFPDEMITFESLKGDIELIDGRAAARNGWYVVRSVLQGNLTKNALEWIITPSVVPGYQYDPVIQISQIGYRENQEKIAVIEMDKRVKEASEISLMRISENGGLEAVKSGKPEWWGTFLRYNYAKFDFSDIAKSGMYKLKYGNTVSEPFMIDNQVYKRHAWQPTLEYYLPVQMCHMRINQLTKVWHGLCHIDDALMAPVDHIHFDGYRQGSSTYTKFKHPQPVPGINVGGWHDAGDYDLRVESQAVTTRVLCYAWELFKPEEDVTTVDQKNKLVEIHIPDGKPDILQQIEHGAMTVVGGYKSLGRLYRGIIESTGRQYSLLGDGAVMTDNLVYDPSLDTGEVRIGRSGIKDDRWVFTEDNPRREIQVAACMANAYRPLKGFNDDLANDCLGLAKDIWESRQSINQSGLVDLAAELFLSTGEEKYLKFIQSNKALVLDRIEMTGPAIARIVSKLTDNEFTAGVKDSLQAYSARVMSLMNETPYGVRYKPAIWGDGWNIQRFGVDQYFLHRGFPEIFSDEPVYNALNFVLGVHPGDNTSSFVSGVGARSLLVAYGVNRDDWSYIPGGSASGTALIRPDLPELKVWPYLWQQTEYVMGGGATNYMFLVLAADDLLEHK